VKCGHCTDALPPCQGQSHPAIPGIQAANQSPSAQCGTIRPARRVRIGIGICTIQREAS
jgi:hypothetical protein